MGVSLGVIAIVAAVTAGVGVGAWQGSKHQQQQQQHTGGYDNSTSTNTTGVDFGLGEIDFGGTQVGSYSSQFLHPLLQVTATLRPQHTTHITMLLITSRQNVNIFHKEHRNQASSKVKRFFRKMSSTLHTTKTVLCIDFVVKNL